jgi:hypothetical protein
MATYEPGEPTELEAQIANVLQAEWPSVFCDACLAFALDVSVDDARDAAMRMPARSSLFDRTMRACVRCERIGEATGLRKT